MKRIQAAVAVLAAAGLLCKTAEVAAGARAGLAACGGTLIPTLFPFMVLAGLIGGTRAGETLGGAVAWMLRPLMRLPKRLGTVLLMSFAGGFPVGARMLAAMLAREEIDPKTAGRALCFCVNAGPSFLVSAVGAGMLHSKAAGLLLLAAQLLSAIIIGAVLFHSEPPALPTARHKPTTVSAGNLFVGAVRDASAGMLTICAFVVAFSAIAALLEAVGLLGWVAQGIGTLLPHLGASFFAAALSGLLEVTGGCIRAATLGTRAGFVLCAFLASFSSLSIIFQIRACFPADSGVSFRPFFRSRLAHGGLTAAFASLLWQFIPPEGIAAATLAGTPIPIATPNTAITALCLIGMCSLLLTPRRANVHIYP